MLSTALSCYVRRNRLCLISSVGHHSTNEYIQLLLMLNGLGDKSFVDDLVASGYCKCESSLCCYEALRFIPRFYDLFFLVSKSIESDWIWLNRTQPDLIAKWPLRSVAAFYPLSGLIGKNQTKCWQGSLLWGFFALVVPCSGACVGYTPLTLLLVIWQVNGRHIFPTSINVGFSTACGDINHYLGTVAILAQGKPSG